MHEKYIQVLYRALIETKFYFGTEEVESYEKGIDLLVRFFQEMREKGSTVYFIGNGGSAAIASHMTADYLKNGKVKTGSLYDSAVMTCLGNDFGYENVFSKSIEFLGQPRDLLVAVSSSGNSSNIINAIKTAKEKKMHVLTLSGFKKENGISKAGEMNVHVGIEEYGIVESVHNIILQQVVDTLMKN